MKVVYGTAGAAMGHEFYECPVQQLDWLGFTSQATCWEDQEPQPWVAITPPEIPSLGALKYVKVSVTVLWVKHPLGMNWHQFVHLPELSFNQFVWSQ